MEAILKYTSLAAATLIAFGLTLLQQINKVPSIMSLQEVQFYNSAGMVSLAAAVLVLALGITFHFQPQSNDLPAGE